VYADITRDYNQNSERLDKYIQIIEAKFVLQKIGKPITSEILQEEIQVYD